MDYLLYVLMLLSVTLNITQYILSNKQRNNKSDKEFEENIDKKTGLLNRLSFDEFLTNFNDKEYNSIGIIMFDIDGLKLINDSMGLKTGDDVLVKVADTIKSTFGFDVKIYRTGGDEFTAILENYRFNSVKAYKYVIKEKIEKINASEENPPISLSIGYSHRDDKILDILEVLKEAEQNMNKEKINNKNSVKSSIVQTLLKTLEARDYITEGHVERINDLAFEIGQEMGMSEYELNDIRLLARFHDIGKVGIPDKILFKKTGLDEDEWKIMRKHSEIGYKIAKSSEGLSHISDCILKHHEWWDGSGYPFKLKGEEIPLKSRIISVADAYDAMINDRPYRKALPTDIAKREIMKGRGSQFDPDIVDSFMRIINKKDAESNSIPKVSKDHISGVVQL
jgi:diguanylate cyclase (GGDEF)-like protein